MDLPFTDIESLLPHRKPFLFVDTIESFDENGRQMCLDIRVEEDNHDIRFSIARNCRACTCNDP